MSDQAQKVSSPAEVKSPAAKAPATAKPATLPPATVPEPLNRVPEAPPGAVVKGHSTLQQLRRKLLILSAVLMVVLPSLAAGLYYAMIASDQYAVETRFAVRGPEGIAAPDILGMFTGVAASGSTLTDSYILMDYIHSKEMLIKLKDVLDVRKIYNHPNADLLAAYSDVEAPNEEFLEYWKKNVRVGFDTSSRVLNLEVRTFSPEDSLALSKAIIDLSEKLVNELSDRARKDAVETARLEVARMEDRLRRSSEALRTFREKTQEIDPALSAQANLQRLSALESQLNEARARLASQRTFMNDSAPPIQVTLAQIEALEQQVTSERAKLGKGSEEQTVKGTLSGAVEDYQGLLLEQEFAQKALVAALSSLERARATADQQQRYLGTFVPPRAPEAALYPKRIQDTLIFFLLALVLWAIGVLIAYAIRDHAS